MEKQLSLFEEENKDRLTIKNIKKTILMLIERYNDINSAWYGDSETILDLIEMYINAIDFN